MATEVSLFVQEPADPSVLREANPYGPDGSGGFNSDLSIEIDPAVSADLRVLAVVDGMVRVIPDPSPATTCSVVLRPSLTAVQDLGVVWGEANGCFVYRSLEQSDVKEALTDALIANQVDFDDVNAMVTASSDMLNSLVEGVFSLWVNRGQDLGRASTSGSSGGWATIGFEVVLLPAGVGKDSAGWDRLVELVERSAATRRLDPATFYSAVQTASTLVSLDPGDSAHPLLTLPTRRVLLELRDEYDEPYEGTAEIGQDGIVSSHTFTAAEHGTIVLDAIATAADCTVTVTNRVLTELPSGGSATAVPSKTLSAPAQWSLQHVFMADLDDEEHWFSGELPRGDLPLFSENNKVTPLIDGIPTFEEMHTALLTVQGTDHFVRLAGWYLGTDFELVPGSSDSTMEAHFTRIDAAGADVRAMLWDQVLEDIAHLAVLGLAETDLLNAGAWGQINDLEHGVAILDTTPLSPTGSVHQKLMVVSGSAGAVAFCGGIDINANRLDDRLHTTYFEPTQGPYHDVHAKIEGPAVAHLNTTFVERWNGYPVDLEGASPIETAIMPTNDPPYEDAPGTHYVQVTRTYAPRNTYVHTYAPDGDLGTLHTTRRAIQRAKKFIYIEDQYLYAYPGSYPFVEAEDTVGILTDLLAALTRIEYLILVISHDGHPPDPYRRHNFIAPLIDAYPDKVFVFTLITPPDRDDVKVHTKSLIVDDIYARIGSSNCCRRSMTHDAECDVHVVDGALLNGGRRMAREYRMDLWGEHLNMQDPARKALLEDPSMALYFWKNLDSFQPLSKFFRVKEYDYLDTAGIDFLGYEVDSDILWSLEDPDGR